MHGCTTDGESLANPIKILPLLAITALAVPWAAEALTKPAAEISKVQAVAIALKAAPGKIVESSYEKAGDQGLTPAHADIDRRG